MHLAGTAVAACCSNTEHSLLSQLVSHFVNPDSRRILSLLPDSQKEAVQFGHEQAGACAFTAPSWAILL